MNDTLLVSLIGAALTGLTIVAYRHPDGYRRILFGIAPLLTFGPLIILTWHLGGIYASIGSAYQVLQQYPNDPMKDHSFGVQSAYEARESLKIFVLYFAPSVAYLVFLRFLPHLGIVNDAKKRI